MGSDRGGHRNRRGNSHRSADGPPSPQAPANPQAVLDMVAQNPVLQQVHVVLQHLVQQGLEHIESPQLRKVALATFTDLLQGGGPSFAMLQGEPAEMPLLRI